MFDFGKQNQQNLARFLGWFKENNYSPHTCWIWYDYSQLGTRHLVAYLTIIPRARVGYEMIDSQRGA